MNEVVDVKEHYLNEFAKQKTLLPGQQATWLQQLRQHAIDLFAKLGLPNKRNEEWKYTSVLPIQKQAFHTATQTMPQLTPQQLQPHLFADEECYNFIFVDGVFYQAPTDLPSGMTICNLAKALENPTEKFAEQLNSTLDAGAHGFLTLNTAFMTDGIYIDVPADQVITKPIHLLFIATQAQQANHIRNLIVAEKNTQLTVIENFVGLHDATYLNNSVTEIIAAKNAKLNHYKLQQESQQGFHIGTLQVAQQQYSEVRSHSFAFGGALVRSDTNIALAAEDCYCHLNGLFIAKNAQHIDHHTRIDHLKPRGTSREFYKGILSDKAKGVFNGKVVVAQDAQQTNADQSNKNLLLSKQAEINTKPQLEIFADDVKCTHGATVGQLDENALFYLRSRGIEAQVAQHLLIDAFAGEIVEQTDFLPLKNKIAALIASEGL